jgi:hypothetical protein
MEHVLCIKYHLNEQNRQKHQYHLSSGARQLRIGVINVNLGATLHGLAVPVQLLTSYVPLG